MPYSTDFDVQRRWQEEHDAENALYFVLTPEQADAMKRYVEAKIARLIDTEQWER